MYFQPVDFYSFENYFNGLATGVRVALQSTGTTDFPGMWEIREGVAKERGYKVPIISVCQLEEQMRLRWTEVSQVVNERFEIEIAAWRRLLESFETVKPTY